MSDTNPEVKCDKCGWVHVAISLDAAHEYANTADVPAGYFRCFRCGSPSRSFVPAGAGDAPDGCTLQAVVVDELNELPVSSEGLQMEIPGENVQQFVLDLAQRHGVRVVRTRLDEFAEIATSLSGDDVVLDLVGQTLVALREKNVISGAQMNSLMFGYLREARSPNQLRAEVSSQPTAKDDAGRCSDSGFLERGLESLERAKTTGVYFTADEVLSGLEDRLNAAKGTLNQ